MSQDILQLKTICKLTYVHMPPQIRLPLSKYIFNNDIKLSDILKFHYSWKKLPKSIFSETECHRLELNVLRVPWLLVMDYIKSLCNVKLNYARLPHSTTQKCAWLEKWCSAVVLLIICCNDCQVRRLSTKFEFLVVTKWLNFLVSLSFFLWHALIPSHRWLH